MTQKSRKKCMYRRVEKPFHSNSLDPEHETSKGDWNQHTERHLSAVTARGTANEGTCYSVKSKRETYNIKQKYGSTVR